MESIFRISILLLYYTRAAIFKPVTFIDLPRSIRAIQIEIDNEPDIEEEDSGNRSQSKGVVQEEVAIRLHPAPQDLRGHIDDYSQDDKQARQGEDEGEVIGELLQSRLRNYQVVIGVNKDKRE